MNRKGFTLIELLAVIVILAIIALIATPLILSVIEKSKQGAFKNSVYGVMKAAEYSSLEYQLKNPITKEIEFTFQDGEVSNIDDLKIDYNGKAPTDGVITIGVDGKVSVALTDGKYCAIKNFDENELSITQVNNASECKIIIPILSVATNGESDTSFLGGPITKGSIESIVFASTNEVPSGVLGSWDVSAAEDGSVMAWYVDSDNNDLYEVTIGGKGKVYANPDSSYLFSYLRNLENIDFTYFDTSKVTNMSGMFVGESNITELDLSHFNTSKVTNMSRMFMGVSSLVNLDLSNFDTSKVTNMGQMFWGTSSLEFLDLRNATFDNVTNTTMMFSYINKDITIYTKNEITKSWLEERLPQNDFTGTVQIMP